MVTEMNEVVARILAQKSARSLDLTLAPESAAPATGGGLAFEVRSNGGGDLDGGWIVVKDDGSREFVQIPPFDVTVDDAE